MRKISLILGLIFVLSCFFVGCSPKNKITDFVKDGEIWTLTRGDMKVTVNSTSGFVTGVANSYDEVSFDAILVDGSISSNVMYGQFGYTSMAGAQTWELPILYPKMKDIPEHTVDNIVATETGFEISLTKDIYHLLYKYTILEDALKLDVVLSSDSEKDQTVNGITFAVQGIKGFDIVNSTFEFPGSTPSGKINFTSTGKYKATVSDYACPVVVVEDKQKSTDVIFVDEVEKWTSGSYYDKNDNPCVAFTAAVEGFLSSTKPMEIGSLYIPMTNPNVGAYKTVQNLWKTLGYKNPEKNELTKDLVALYSSHPFGTMDTNYFNRWTLSEYADKMASIANMGFDAVWLLPVFQHTGDNVYEPIDQGLIDMRYGGIEQAKEFIEKTHGLGMSVLFDFVPHGPRPVYPFAKEHQDWISKDILGENQIEWDCVSFDYNNPEYYKYNVELAEYYAREIGLNGARIDCSMGGLSNWYSPIGLRASAAGLMAGKNVVDALYKGFTNVNPNAIILPENFHPSPAYAEVTDVFYDMPLYRCIYNLNQRNLPVTQYVKELTN
ncbi:MAG: alpha-amylase family glycosyl hydrolase, partial [Clostridia bacterium]|nr:alpha-amylase family glycosyl hydrolase [Clostridia bacterium]